MCVCRTPMVAVTTVFLGVLVISLLMSYGVQFNFVCTAFITLVIVSGHFTVNSGNSDKEESPC